MRNSDIFYYNALKYQNERKAILDEFENMAQRLQSAIGSQYYETEMKKAVEKRDNALSSLI